MADMGMAIERLHPPRRLINFFNPVMVWLIKRIGPLGRSLLVLHYQGRKTGRRYHVPTGYRQTGDHLSVLTDSSWRHNFDGGRRVEVTHQGRRVPALATLIEDPDQVASALEAAVKELGMGRAGRQLGVRINTGRPPTRDEWREFIVRSRLGLVRVDLG